MTNWPPKRGQKATPAATIPSTSVTGMLRSSAPTVFPVADGDVGLRRNPPTASLNSHAWKINTAKPITESHEKWVTYHADHAANQAAMPIRKKRTRWIEFPPTSSRAR